MRSIEHTFSVIREREPFWSDYVCFAEAVKGREYQPRQIATWFKKLVPKDEHIGTDKNKLLEHLGSL